LQVFSQPIHIDAGEPLGGFTDERRSIAKSNALELNGWSFNDAASGRSIELCAVDALYAGDLVDVLAPLNSKRIFAASHTHYAPFLDSRKPQLGPVSKGTLLAYRDALLGAQMHPITPARCVIFKAEVPIPIYRRFDAPDNILSRFLTKTAGMFPNAMQDIDTNIYLFVFENMHSDATFVLILHACHPVSRAERSQTSPDYVGSIRTAVRERFGNVPCIFLQGCAGDLRPNLAKKRLNWIPRSRLNWQFDWTLSVVNEASVDAAYSFAVAKAIACQTIVLSADSVRVDKLNLDLLHQGLIECPVIVIANQLRFEFIPFEVSHRFHLEAQSDNSMRFIVSCADRTLGYLPHPSQIAARGYEVDGSRDCMGLAQRVILRKGVIW
jgi:hypothetical protein